MYSIFKISRMELLLGLGAGMLVVLVWKITGLYDKYPEDMYYVIGAVAAIVGIKVRSRNKTS